MGIRKFYFFLLIVAFVSFSHVKVSAQSAPPADSSEYVSVVKKIQARSYAEEGAVSLNQSSTITRMLDQNAETNRYNQTMQGYRIRIYRDNSQNARQRSESIIATFKERYPYVGAYRSYDNPYFMVMVGDFRTVDEAIKFQSQVASDYGSEYSSTYIIKEKIFFPPIVNHE